MPTADCITPINYTVLLATLVMYNVQAVYVSYLCHVILNWCSRKQQSIATIESKQCLPTHTVNYPPHMYRSIIKQVPPQPQPTSNKPRSTLHCLRLIQYHVLPLEAFKILFVQNYNVVTRYKYVERRISSVQMFRVPVLHIKHVEHHQYTASRRCHTQGLQCLA
jgi:hypothetical protein